MPWRGLHSQHYDYKRVALPTELSRHAAVMLDPINLQNYTQLHARGFTATINNNGRFIFRPPLNYQVVAQNIRVADVLSHNQQSNNDNSEPQVRSLQHVVRGILDSDDVAITRQGHNAENQRRFLYPANHAVFSAVERDVARAVRQQNYAVSTATTHG